MSPHPRQVTPLRAAYGLIAVVAAFISLPAASAVASGLTTGFSGDAFLTGGTAANRAVWLGRAASLGADEVRLSVLWADVAPQHRPAGFDPSNPSSPGYNWSATDASVRSISAKGLTVVIQILDAPRWAEGPNMPRDAEAGSWEPNPTQFAAFAQAAVTRYSGSFPDPSHPGGFLPRVSYWQAWNEENLALYLSPQWVREDGHWVAASPNIYRPLLNGFYRAVKSVNSSNFVLMGGTAPFGDPPGHFRMRPVTFDQDLFCISSTLKTTSCPGPVYLDAIDHHPYDWGPPTTKADSANDVTVPEIWKLTRLLDAGVRSGTVLPDATKQVWTTEIMWDSNPPDKAYGSVSLTNQARYLEQAFYLLWRQGVSTIMWLQIRDSAPLRHYNDAFNWCGLYSYSDKAKPAATAFRFPFVTNRLSTDAVQAWGRAPAAGTLTIYQREGGRWEPLEHLQVGTQQVFLTTLHIHGSATLRAKVDGFTSLSWHQRR